MLLLWPIITSITISELKSAECYYRFTIKYGGDSCSDSIYINKSENLIRHQDLIISNYFNFCGVEKTHNLTSSRTLFRKDTMFSRFNSPTLLAGDQIREYVDCFAGIETFIVYAR